MRRPWATAPTVVALVCVALLTGCSSNHPGVPDATYQKARKALITQLVALPGATITATIESSIEAGRGNVGVNAQLPAAATAAQLGAVGDSIERTIWLSQLDPLGRININLSREGSTVRVERRLYHDAIDRKPLGVKYGPQPDSLPG
jgi:hypothetical protein